MEDQSLRHLLQLKKLETPGPEYFDLFLDEFHRYQRAERLTSPSVWGRLRDGIIEILQSSYRPAYAYGSTFVAVLVLGVLAISQDTATQPSQEDAISLNAFVMGDQVVSPNGIPTPSASVDFVSLEYTDAFSQQPELVHNTAYATSPSAELQEPAAPRYVTGESVLSDYETAMAF